MLLMWNEKSWRCEKCNYSINRKSSLTTHQKSKGCNKIWVKFSSGLLLQILFNLVHVQINILQPVQQFEERLPVEVASQPQF